MTLSTALPAAPFTPVVPTPVQTAMHLPGRPATNGHPRAKRTTAQHGQVHIRRVDSQSPYDRAFLDHNFGTDRQAASIDRLDRHAARVSLLQPVGWCGTRGGY